MLANKGGTRRKVRRRSIIGRERPIAVSLSVLAALILTGCAPFGAAEPTPTASPLPTEEPGGEGEVHQTELAQGSESPTPAQTATLSPTLLPTPTEIPPSPTPTFTATPVPATPTPAATAAPTASSTPTPRPVRTKPSPTPTPALPGKLVFQTTIGGDFYVINADGTGLRRITDGADPIWSPDGQQIAFVRWRNPRGVWVVNADGSGERRLFDWNEARWPSWSHDGSRILFSRQHGGRPSQAKCFWGFCFTIEGRPYWRLAVVRLVDEDFREPPSAFISLAPIWAPEEDRIVYDDQHGLRIQSEDESVSYLITDDARDTSPAWSPDGQKVAFTRRQHDHWEVYVVDVDGRNLKRLTDTPKKPNGEVGNSAAPAWSPDGQYIAFLTDRTGRWEIWIMRPGGKGQRPMFDLELDGLPLEYAHVAERAISWTR
jgi:TolB protein